MKRQSTCFHTCLALFFLVVVHIPLYCFDLSFDFIPFDLLSHDSSKASERADKAKRLLLSSKEEDRYEGIHLLQSLIQESSFQRLPLDTQIHIIFLLSGGYEKIQQLNEQVLLLQQQLKRPELASYTVPMKAALIHAYLLQKDTKEADALLKQLLSLSYKALAPQDKKAIALACVMRDQTLFSMIREAKEHMSLGKFQKASFILEKVYSTLSFEPIPCQGSPLTRKHVSQEILFSLAECFLFLGKNSLALDTVSRLLNESADLPPTMKTQALFLKDVAQGFYPREEVIKLAICQPEYGTQCLLWLVQQSLFQPMIPLQVPELNSPYSSLIRQYIDATKALVQGDAPKACALFREKLPEALVHAHSFKKYYLEGYQEALWLRSLICFFAEQQDCFERTFIESENLCQILEEQQMVSRRVCFEALLLMYKRKPLTADSLTPSPQQIPHVISQSLLSLLSGMTLSPSTLSWSDQLFLHTAAVYTQSHEMIDPPVVTDNEQPIFQFFSTLVHLQDGSYDWQKRKGEIETLMTEDALKDARSKLIHTFLTHVIKAQKQEEILPLLRQFFDTSSGYTRRREALFDSFLLIPSPCDEKKQIAEELLKPPFDTWTMLLLIHLQKTGQLSRYAYPITFNSLIEVLHTLDQAHNLTKEATKPQEYEQRKLLICRALESFTKAASSIMAFLRLPHTHEEQTIILGILCKTISEWSDLLFSEILFEHLTTELDTHLYASLLALRSTDNFLSLIDTDNELSFRPRTQQEIKELITATELFLCTFQKQYDEALSRIRTFPPESFFLSPPHIRGVLYLTQSLRKNKNIALAWPLIKQLNETEIKQVHQELALQVAIEKSLCLKEKGSISQAMACLAWVINDSAISSLRIKAMVLRADLYMLVKRPELAIRQLEAAKGKGGEWGIIAERKLEAIQAEWQGLPVIIRQDAKAQIPKKRRAAHKPRIK